MTDKKIRPLSRPVRAHIGARLGKVYLDGRLICECRLDDDAALIVAAINEREELREKLADLAVDTSLPLSGRVAELLRYLSGWGVDKAGGTA